MKTVFALLTLLVTLSASQVSITSKDGFKLYGWLEKPSAVKKTYPLILFAHQFGADHTIWDALAKKLRAKGYATLSVDLRGHGKSIMQNGKENKVITDTKVNHIHEALVQSDKKVNFANIPSDLSGWLEFASEDETLNLDQLYLFGSSLGAGSIIPLLNDYDAKALVAISAGKQKALAADIDMALGTSMCKTLFIASKNDPLGATQRTLEYEKQAIAGTAIIVPGEGHGTVLLPQSEHYIMSFLKSIR